MERVYRSAANDGRLQLSVAMMPVSEQGYLLPPVDRLDGAPTGEDAGPRLRVGPLRMFFDGGDNCAVCLSIAQGLEAAIGTAVRMIRARTLLPLRFAARARGRLGADLHIHSGIRYYPSDADALRIMRRATERGWSLAIHAMGNEAVSQAVRTLASVKRPNGSARPQRIEHAMLADRATMRRAADAGIMVVSQPSFMRVPAVEFTPPMHGLPPLAFRSMLDAGLRVAASSDAPVVPLAPLDGVRDAVRRRTPAGAALAPDEAVTTMEALAMYTRDAALACGCLREAGTLEPGKAADLVILSADPATSGPDITVAETVLGGKTVHRSAEQLL